MKKILVIQQKMIGDVLVSSILCRNLVEKYPDAQIDYLVHHNTTAVLQHATSGYRVIEVSEKEKKSKWAFLKLALKLRKENYDTVIDCYSKLESWIIVAFSGAKNKISFKKKHTSFLYTHNIERITEPKTNWGLTIEQRLKLLYPLDICNPNIIEPQIVVSKEEDEWAKKMLCEYGVNLNKPLIMISALGSSPQKTYPLPYMATLLDEITTKVSDVTILLNYIPNQSQQIQELLSYCSPKTKANIKEDIIGKNIREFIAIMKQCQVIIGNDGGAINMAKALDKPSFSIYSPIINKSGWNSFEDGKKHISLELSDFKPEIIEKLSNKDIKSQNQSLYLNFNPELMFPQLHHFLANNIS